MATIDFSVIGTVFRLPLSTQQSLDELGTGPSSQVIDGSVASNNRRGEKVDLYHVRYYLKHYEVPKELKHLELKEKRRKTHSLLTCVKHFKLDEDRTTVWYCGRSRKKKAKVLFQPAEVKEALRQSHPYDIGTRHPGIKRMHDIVTRNYYWTSITKDVKDWISACPKCSQKRLHITDERNEILKVNDPMDVMRLDVIGPFSTTCRGNCFVMSLTDVYSKWVEAEPIPDKTIECAIRILDSVYFRLGAPKQIISSLGKAFITKLNHGLTNKELPTIDTVISGCFPLLRDDNEEYFKLAMKQFCNSQQATWDQDLPQLLWILRSRKDSRTNLSPYRLMFGREPHLQGHIIPERHDVTVGPVTNSDGDAGQDGDG